MPIQEHPATGTILICDFTGMKEPEMVKRRPVVVISPKIAVRRGLCTVLGLSTVPPPWDDGPNWNKGDMATLWVSTALILSEWGNQSADNGNICTTGARSRNESNTLLRFARYGPASITKHLA
jgi:hypothetical protein